MGTDTKDSLYLLSREYLKRYGKIIDDLSEIEGLKRSAIKFLVKVKNHFLGVWILDWKRNVGTDKIIHIERLIQRSNLSGGFIITNKFSSNARQLAEQTDSLILIEKSEILYHSKGTF
ncbi:MAG: restriction endonuclease [Candidatus Heimdallarchaeum endolithica]|uniref:Restriction endonuclease n=1 Tax=Candidatus Heimdallarchaeum endolithica TaxID=2876572 RepID=A0A9Y1BQ71_9ARCH|nr:MAG: restriction endonuclease [Candidatus Heimdallarchaeum endolithica]